MKLEHLISLIVAVAGTGGISTWLKNRQDSHAALRDDARDDFVAVNKTLHEQIKLLKEGQTELRNMYADLKSKHAILESANRKLIVENRELIDENLTWERKYDDSTKRISELEKRVKYLEAEKEM